MLPPFNRFFHGLLLGITGCLWANENSFKLNGEIYLANRIGFNIHQSSVLNPSIYDIPTETFSTVKLFLRTSYIFNKNDHHLSINLGGVLGGVIYDGTRNDADGSSLYTYFGFWRGTEATRVFGQGKPEDFSRAAKRYSINLANLSYGYGKYFNFTVGRFAVRDGSWLTGYIQGGVITSNILPKTTLWIQTTNTRASLSTVSLKDFRYVNRVGYWIIMGGARINIGGWSIKPELYGQIKRYLAPQIDVIFDSSKTSSRFFSHKTQILFMYVHNIDQTLTSSYNNYRDTTHPIGYGGFTFFLKETLVYKNHHMGAAFLKNFDNPNELIGSTGTPYGFSLWTNNIYENSGWSNAQRRDATNVFVFMGGKYLNNSLGWDVVYRYTNAARAYEKSLQLGLNYTYNKSYWIRTILEFYTTTTRTGYRLQRVTVKEDVTKDRSSLWIYGGYRF